MMNYNDIKVGDMVKVELMSKRNCKSEFTDCQVIKVTAKRFTVRYNEEFNFTFTKDGVIYDQPRLSKSHDIFLG